MDKLILVTKNLSAPIVLLVLTALVAVAGSILPLSAGVALTATLVGSGVFSIALVWLLVGLSIRVQEA
jgi:uncharacterized MnhB-related membrane protein